MKKKVRQGQTYYQLIKAFDQEVDKEIYIVEKHFVISVDNYWVNTSSIGADWSWSTPKKSFSKIYSTKAQMKKFIKLNPV